MVFLPAAFFELVDRGMGVVSLNSFLYPGFRLRMNNFVLEGKVQQEISYARCEMYTHLCALSVHPCLGLCGSL